MMALAEPLTEQASAWIRDHAWSGLLREEHRTTPSFHTTCPCEYALSDWCEMGKHGRCHRAEGLPAWEGLICGRGGTEPVFFAEEFEHPTLTSATGPRRERLAMVWLADRVCRWVCPCACHTAPTPPAPPAQLDLFEVTT